MLGAVVLEYLEEDNRLIGLRIIQIKLTVIKNGQITWMQKWDKYGIVYNNEVITWK